MSEELIDGFNGKKLNRDNHISDPTVLQPGQLVIVRVREGRQ